MDSQFNTNQQTALLGLSLVPSVLSLLSLEDCTLKLADMYHEDLPARDCTESELHCWWMKWQQEFHDNGESGLPSTPTSALRHATTIIFPNIKVLLSNLLTLPVTTCSAERSFSALKRIKTTARLTMGTERLTGLALLHIHRDISIEFSDILDEFARRHPRRLQVANILAD